MPLESTVYINGLDPSNPAGTDLISEADNHLRLIKSAIKASFPNITEPLTATAAQLNQVPTLVPIGIISAWYGAAGDIPTGWALCNGQTVTRTDGGGSITTPNLIDKAIVGAGTIAAQGASVGATTASTTSAAAGAHSHTISGGSHTHSATVGGITLSLAQIPSHRHGNGVADDNNSGLMWRGTQPTTGIATGVQNAGTGPIEGLTESVGGGSAHDHPITVDSSTHTHTADAVSDHQHTFAVPIVQPSYGLHYIMKF